MTDGPWSMWAGRCGEDGLYENTPGFVYAFPDRRHPEAYGFTKPVVVMVIEDPEGDHIGWIGNERDAPGREPRGYPEFIWPLVHDHPTPDLYFRMCFTYGPQAEVDAGRGRIVRLRLEEVS